MTLFAGHRPQDTNALVTLPALTERAALKLLYLIESGLEHPSSADELSIALEKWGGLERFKEQVTSPSLRGDTSDITPLMRAYEDLLPKLQRIWQRNLLDIELPQQSYVSKLYFSPSGDRIIASITSADSGYLFLNVLSGEVFKHPNRTSTMPLEEVIFLPNGPEMYGQIRFDDSYALLNLITGEVLETEGAAITAIQNPVFSPDGREAYLAIHLAWNARLLHLPSERVLDTALSIQHIRDITFSPDGEQVFAWASRMGSSREQRNVIVNARTGGLVFDLRDEYSFAERPLFSQDGAHGYSRVQIRGSHQVLDLIHSQILTLPGKHIEEVCRVSVSPCQDEAVAHVKIDKSYHLLELFSRRLLPSPSSPISMLMMDPPTFSPDGKQIISTVSTGDGWHYLDGRTGRFHSMPCTRFAEAMIPTFSPDGTSALGRVRVGDYWCFVDILAGAFLPNGEDNIERAGVPVFSSDSKSAYALCRALGQFFYLNVHTGRRTIIPLTNLTEAEEPIVLADEAGAFARVSTGGIHSLLNLQTGTLLNCPGKKTTNVYLVKRVPELNTAFALVRNSDDSCAIIDMRTGEWIHIPGSRVSYVSTPLVCAATNDVVVSCSVDNQKRAFNVTTRSFIKLPDDSDMSWQDGVVIKDRALLVPVTRAGGQSAIYDLTGDVISRINQERGRHGRS